MIEFKIYILCKSSIFLPFNENMSAHFLQEFYFSIIFAQSKETAEPLERA